MIDRTNLAENWRENTVDNGLKGRRYFLKGGWISYPLVLGSDNEESKRAKKATDSTGSKQIGVQD